MTVLDPSTGFFGQLPISFSAGYAYSGAVLDQSTIFIAGGHLSGQGAMNTLFKLDLHDLSLTHLSSFSSPRNYVGLTKIGQELFVVGGHSGPQRLRSIERYSIARNQWFTYGEEMQEKRSDAGVAALNGKIYVVGGFDGFKQHRSMEIFDPKNGTWRAERSLMREDSVETEMMRTGERRDDARVSTSMTRDETQERTWKTGGQKDGTNPSG